MPYDVRRRGSSYQVVDDNGKVVGTHPTRTAARPIDTMSLTAKELRKLFTVLDDLESSNERE